MSEGLTPEDIAAAEAKRKAEIAARLKLKAETIERMTVHRIFVKHPGETTPSQSICAGCGASHTRRGHCTNCGARSGETITRGRGLRRGAQA